MSDVLSLAWLQLILHCIDFFCCHSKNHHFLLAKTGNQLCMLYENRVMRLTTQHAFVWHTFMQLVFVPEPRSPVLGMYITIKCKKPKRILSKLQHFNEVPLFSCQSLKIMSSQEISMQWNYVKSVAKERGNSSFSGLDSDAKKEPLRKFLIPKRHQVLSGQNTMPQ